MAPSGPAEDLSSTLFGFQYLLLHGWCRSGIWWPDSAITQAGTQSHYHYCFQKSSSEFRAAVVLHGPVSSGRPSPPTRTELCLPFLCARAHKWKPRAPCPEMCLQNLFMKSEAMEECWVNFSSDYQLRVMYTPN